MHILKNVLLDWILCMECVYISFILVGQELGKLFWVLNSSQSKNLNIICKNHICLKQFFTHLFKTDYYQVIKYHISITKNFDL